MNKVIFHASRPPEQTREIFERQMSDPYYPISLDYLPAQKDFVDVASNPFRHVGIAAHPFPLHHPQGATGYRLESKGKVITHASDVKHGHDKLDKTLREFTQDADVLIYDAQYTPNEYCSWRVTLPSECVSLNRPGFEDFIHPRHRRGGGNRHFHGLLRSPRTLRRRSSP